MSTCLDEITVLSVCYNSKSVIAKSLTPFMGANQVIVIDNASADGSADYIEKTLPSVTLIKNKTNKGYGAGVNSVLSQVKTPYLLFVTPDVELTLEGVEELYKALIKYDDAAFVAPQLEVPRHGLENWVMGPWEHTHNKADFTPDGNFCTWFLPGTTNLWRTSVLQDLGGYDENIFLYHEDLELCHRVNQAGHSIICIPSVVAFHNNSHSAGASSMKLHWRKDWNYAWGNLYILDKYSGRSTMWKEVRRSLALKCLKSMFYILVLDKKRFIRDAGAMSGYIAYIAGYQPKR